MSRSGLPEDPRKRRRQLFKNVYITYREWEAQIVDHGTEPFLSIGSEEIFFYDLMAGYDALPPRQREAFDYHLLQGMTEGEAARIMFPGSQWSTPVQQYMNSALDRMIKAYDDVQEGRRSRG